MNDDVFGSLEDDLHFPAFIAGLGRLEPDFMGELVEDFKGVWRWSEGEPRPSDVDLMPRSRGYRFAEPETVPRGGIGVVSPVSTERRSLWEGILAAVRPPEAPAREEIGIPVSLLADAEIFEMLDPSYMGGSHRYLGHDASGIGGLGQADALDIKSFVLNKSTRAEYRGINSIQLNKGGDWVDLRVPTGKYKSARFKKTVHWKKYKKKVTGGRGDKVGEDTDETHFTLAEGENLRVDCKEGWLVDKAGYRRDRYIDRNISITLLDAVAIVTRKDPDTGETITTTEKLESGQSPSGAPPVDLLPDMPGWGKWAFGGLVVVGVLGSAYYASKHSRGLMLKTVRKTGVV